MTFNEIIKLALNAIKESIDEELSKENIRLAYIKSSEDNNFKMCSKTEIDSFLQDL